MPSKVQQKRAKQLKRSDQAVALFRREVEEQERLVEALKTHQQDRNERLGRIKNLLSSGSELASAVGAWGETSPTKPNKDTAASPCGCNGSCDSAAAAVTPLYSDPINLPEAGKANTLCDSDETENERNRDDPPTAVKVSEIKGLAADVMQAIMEEFGGYMAGMENHRAILEGLKDPSTTAAHVPVGDVEAEEEAALQELVEFRQRLKDKKRNRNSRKQKSKKGGKTEGATEAGPERTGSAPYHTDHGDAVVQCSADAELYIGLLEKLTSAGGELAVCLSEEQGVPPNTLREGGSSAPDDSPAWLLEGFEASPTTGHATIAHATTADACGELDEDRYSDDFEGDDQVDE